MSLGSLSSLRQSSPSVFDKRLQNSLWKDSPNSSVPLYKEMKNKLKTLPQDIQELLRCVSLRAAEHTVPAYLVGGCVRDLLLGVQNLDLDIVVEGDGIAFAEALAQSLNAKLICHRRFGTATLYAGQRHKIDIATARKEVYPSPGHLPEVSSGVLKEDLFRRDFAVNAMAIDLTQECFGVLIDYFGGRDDLRAGVVRTLHDASFLDDSTRILRAIRFEQRYDFRIEPHTMKNLKEAVKLKMLNRMEPQRVRDELMLLLREQHAVKAVRRLGQLVGFDFLHPRLHVTARTFALMRAVRRQLDWFRKAHPQRRYLDTWLMNFMALIDGLDTVSTAALCKKLMLRRGEDMRIVSFKRIKKSSLESISRPDVKPSRIFVFFEPLSYEVILMLKAKHSNTFLQEYIRDFFDIYTDIRLHSSGHDLRSLGLSPGPVYKKIFTRVLHAKLNGKIKTHEEELALIRRLTQSLKREGVTPGLIG